jgi:hypothetical protein
MDMMLRFLIGGIVVSVFAILGDMVKPESLGGVFAAAPTIALATLVLTMHKHGGVYVATEARSMVAGAIAFFGADDGDRSLASMVCNGRHLLGALAAEIGRCA